eukprot:13255090-Alexandrium_andersonii.AAC.1
MSGKKDLLPHDGRGVMMASPKWFQARSPELPRSPFCAAVRAEREHGDEYLPRAPGSYVNT